jgi:DNA polymerase I-like protein with 3'-5' exonuclease and polymerase domains
MRVKVGGVPIIAQFHDEIVCLVRKGKREKLTTFLKKCIKETNEFLQLNRELDCSVDFGESYAKIH